jgi:MFS transporter, DHA3 family, macrolide efflux protein
LVSGEGEGVKEVSRKMKQDVGAGPFKKVFKNPSYFLYWLSYSLSAIAFELLLFTLMVILFDATKTALGMGAFAAIFMSCMMVFGPMAGTCIDRWQRKRVFIACNLLLAALAIAIKFLEGAFWIYATWFLGSVLFTFLRSVRTALITNLFSEESYFKANSAFMLSLNLSKIGGPLIGGVLIISFPREWIIYTIASFFLLSSFLISAIRFRPVSLRGLAQRPMFWNFRDLISGILFIFSSKHLRFYILLGFFWRLYFASQLPLFILFVKDYLGKGTQEYSLFMTCLAVGGAIGSFIAGSIESFLNRKTLIYGGLGASCLLFAAMSMSHYFPLVLLLVGSSNLAFFIGVVAIHSDIQRTTPNEVRGQVFASSPTILVPSGLVSILFASTIADKVGVIWVFFVSAVMAFLTLPLIHYVNEWLGFERRPELKGNVIPHH